MNKFSSHTEENFWPCVSDMFLALFVIALVMYTTASNEKGRADKYIAETALEEACGLFRDLKEIYPNNTFLKTVEPNKLENSQRNELNSTNGKKHLPKLAELLFRLHEQPILNHHTASDVNLYPSSDEMGYDFDTYPYTKAVRLLYYTVTGKSMAHDTPCYDDHLREIRAFLAARKALNIGMPPEQQIEELQQKIAALKKEICELEQEIAKLKEIYQNPAELKVKITKLKEEVARLESKLQELLEKFQATSADEVTAKLKDEIAKLKLSIEKIKKSPDYYKDNRVLVMEEVRKLLKKGSYRRLRAKADMQTGVIRIPHEAIGFAPGGFRKNTGFKTLTSGESRVWSYYQDGTPRLDNDKSSANLDVFAQLLDEIATLVKKGSLPIDNIAIECHTDADNTDSDGNELGKYYNDGLSLNRAFFIWDEINKKVRIEQYTNQAGLPLFTLSGFGCRVKAPNATSGMDETNRRIEIRLNCTPAKKSVTATK